MTHRRKVSLALILLALHPVAVASELDATVFYSEAEREATATHGLSLVPVFLVIRNVSNHVIRLPTRRDGYRRPREVGSGQWYEKGVLVLPVIFGFDNLRDQTPIIVSEAEFAPVELRPGESTVFELSYKTVDSEKRHEPELMVSFEVLPDFAARYHLWSGRMDVVGKEGNSRWKLSSFQKSKPANEPNHSPEPTPGAVH